MSSTEERELLVHEIERISVESYEDGLGYGWHQISDSVTRGLHTAGQVLQIEKPKPPSSYKLYLVNCKQSDLASLAICKSLSTTELLPMKAMHIPDNSEFEVSCRDGDKVRVKLSKKPTLFKINDQGIFTFEESSDNSQGGIQKKLSYETSKDCDSFTAQFGCNDDGLSLNGDFALKCLNESSYEAEYRTDHHRSIIMRLDVVESDSERILQANTSRSLKSKVADQNQFREEVLSQVVPLAKKVEKIEEDISQTRDDIQYIKRLMLNKENLHSNINLVCHSTSKDINLAESTYRPNTQDYKEVKNKLSREATEKSTKVEMFTERDLYGARKDSKHSLVKFSTRACDTGMITPFKTHDNLNDSKDTRSFKEGLKVISRTRCSKRLQTILKKIDKMKPLSKESPAGHKLLRDLTTKSKTQRESRRSKEACRIPKSQVVTKLKQTPRSFQSKTKQKPPTSLFRLTRRQSTHIDQTTALVNTTADGVLQSTSRQNRQANFFSNSRSAVANK